VYRQYSLVAYQIQSKKRFLLIGLQIPFPGIRGIGGLINIIRGKEYACQVSIDCGAVRKSHISYESDIS
jgi:hypothetical protein